MRQILEDAILSRLPSRDGMWSCSSTLLQKKARCKWRCQGCCGPPMQPGGGTTKSQFRTECAHLNKLNADYQARLEADRIGRGHRAPPPVTCPWGACLGYSIDGIVGAKEAEEQEIC